MPRSHHRIFRLLLTTAFQPMIRRLCLWQNFKKLETKDLPISTPDCAKSLGSLTRADITSIARGFIALVLSSSSEEEAVTRFITMYPSMKELYDTHDADHFEELLIITSVQS